jgi:hypothetical protein
LYTSAFNKRLSGAFGFFFILATVFCNFLI